MIAPRRIVERLIQAPSSITTLGPMVTFGPIRQPSPIFAEESLQKSSIRWMMIAPYRIVAAFTD